MKKRLARPLLLSGSLLASHGAAATDPPKSPQGFLFSAVRFGPSELGRRWARVRPEAATRFPSLHFKAVEDLHMTVVYLGAPWHPAQLDKIRALSRLQIPEAVPLRPVPTRMGRQGRVVALELQGLPASVVAAVVAQKAALKAAGLKGPEAFDDSFRAHVTLAEAADRSPSPEQAAELDRFLAWVSTALDLPTLTLTLEPTTPTDLLLAGLPRPKDGPEYLTVEQVIQARPQGEARP